MGKLIAIEGLDGSGKDTQSKLLFADLTEEGRSVRLISFPDYESPSSTLVKMYLGGELGKNPGDVNAYAATMMFAADRFVSYKKDWGEFHAEKDNIIIANRYTTSNAIHQLSKLDREEWDEFLPWLYDFEFGKLGLPVPDLVIYLEVKPEVTLEYVRKRSMETGRKMDIHEKDREYMMHCYKAAVYAADKLGWVRIQCCNEEGTDLLPIDEIQEKIQESVIKFLDVKE
ncbi:MAG: deoxynucleoside kinase [Clostridia bacterium]|nr:deoxynucleoside kinase [Clostridia bacterium]